MYQQLNINSYKTFFVLGNNEDEKKQKREVIINISVRFLSENESCNSDKLEDTICYAGLINFLADRLEGRRFNLIERAGQFVYYAVKEYAQENYNKKCNKDSKNNNQNDCSASALVKVEIIKKNLPVKDLESASFIVADW